jgi:hypothetical protein
MRVNGTGVGIGTTAPYGSLSIAAVPVGTSYYGMVSIGTNWVGGTGSFAGSSSGTEIAVNAPSGYSGSLMELQVNGTSALAVDNKGDIASTSNNAAGFTQTFGGSAWGAARIGNAYFGMDSSSGGIGWTGGLANAVFVVQNADYPLEFGTNATIQMVINTTGNVGIGTTSPATTLEVGGATQLDGPLR